MTEASQQTSKLQPSMASSLDVPGQAPAGLASKAELRRWIHQRISHSSAVNSNSPAADRASRLNELQARVERLLAMHPGLWLGYRAKDHEVALPTSVTLAYPRVEGERLDFWVGGRELAVSRYGVEEPDLQDSSWRAVDLSQVVGVLVPGIAFDVLGQRLGRGGGYYDRFLRELLLKRTSVSRPLMVGVGWAEQLIDQVPTEEHDVILDGVLTDRPTIWRFAAAPSAGAGKKGGR